MGSDVADAAAQGFRMMMVERTMERDAGLKQAVLQAAPNLGTYDGVDNFSGASQTRGPAPDRSNER